MTIREKLKNTDILELLNKLNDGLEDCCIIDAYYDDDGNATEEWCAGYTNCQECLSEWLNARVKEG